MSDTKACPYCGEQILAVAVKCKHCGSSLDSVSATTVIRNQFRMRPVFVVPFVALIFIVAACVIYNWSQTGAPFGRGFTDAGIKSVEQDIRTQYQKERDVTVEQVSMIKESAKHLTGFVKLRQPKIGESMRTCSATMGEDSRVIWKCE